MSGEFKKQKTKELNKTGVKKKMNREFIREMSEKVNKNKTW